MSEILIFGGTTEGRLLASFCDENNLEATVCVTSQYGAELIDRSDKIKVVTGKLDACQMQKMIYDGNYKKVIDATHPYALEATANIKKSCKLCNVLYYRVCREESDIVSGVCVNDNDELIAYLNSNDKVILSTLGSKELPLLKNVHNYSERVWIRVLEADKIAEYCESLGFSKERMIMGKGPFSVAQNICHIKMSNAKILLTKDSGLRGGYPEKVGATEECGIELVTLKRPAETGYTLEQIMEELL